MRLFAAIALALLSATVGAKTLRYASQFDPGTMDPHALASTYNNRVLSQVYEPLVGRDADFKVEARLALSWTPLEGGKGWRFKLRPNVKFHDGTPFTADDVVFNVTRALMPTSAHKTTLPNVTGARKVDDLTVDVFTTQATPVLPVAMSNLRLMSKAWSVKNRCEKPQDYNAKEEVYSSRNANGTGPYKLVRWDTDVKVVLAANDQYWGKKGNVTEATYFVVSSAATRVAALLSGEMDFVIDPAVQDLDRLRNSPGVTVEQAIRMLRQAGTAVIVGMAPQNQTSGFDPLLFVQKEARLLGCWYGSSRPRLDFHRFIEMTLAGKLKVKEMITRRYSLDEINEAYDSLGRGEVARSVVTFPM